MAITAISPHFSLPLDTPHPLLLKPHQRLPLSMPFTHSVFCSAPLPLQHSDRHILAAPIFSSSPSSDSYLNDHPPTQLPFLSPEDAGKLQCLQHFSYSHRVTGGCLTVGLVGVEQIDPTVWLLAESFAESMLVPKQYVRFLAFLVRQYVMERRALMPYTATLIGIYVGNSGGEEELAGTVEISFNARGANTAPPTPVAPRDSPYICNMAVKKELRRRGIGWHLLRASEELITQISTTREVYLHCRMIDAAPLQMYTKAGYSVVKTDNILTWLTLQRRKHLMCKRLPAF